MALTSVRFRGFKALSDYTIALKHMNVLVGPNNSGKSTILGAFRVLAAGLRRAHAKRAEWQELGDRARLGYKIPNDSISISLENIHTDYADVDTTVVFKLSNGNDLELLFPISGDCYLLPDAQGHSIQSTSAFSAQFPVTVGIVPVLGPVEQDEMLVQEKTIRDGLAEYSRRASRHFRSYWYYHGAEFDRFRTRLNETWPALDLHAPEIADPPLGRRLAMFCDEGRVPRELFWAGFGYQVWCQILTHLVRDSGSSLLVIDEPEIYLHPELQRQLVNILRELGPDIVMATHSSEVVGEAEPDEIMLVDKTARSARRVVSVEGIRKALNVLGSVHNAVLTQVARTRRVLFVEGEDFKLLERLCPADRPFRACRSDRLRCAGNGRLPRARRTPRIVPRHA